MKKKHLVLLYMAVVFVALLLLLTWRGAHRTNQDFEILSDPPIYLIERIKTLGDNNLAFRLNALKLQSTGDYMTKVAGLRQYNYLKLSEWLRFLDNLDYQSNFSPALARYYFGATDNQDDLKIVADYLIAHQQLSPETKWWWLYSALNIMYYRLNQREEAQQLAITLSNTADNKVPKWMREIPAVFLAESGQKEQALRFIREMSGRYRDFTQREIDFMNFFVQKRLGFPNEEIESYILDVDF